MSPALLTLTAGYLGLVAVLAVLAALGVRCRPAVQTGIVVAELVLVLQAALDLVKLARGHRPPEPAVHIGYVLVSIGLLPLLLGRAGGRPRELGAGEARTGLLVVALACGVGVVVVARMHATWQ